MLKVALIGCGLVSEGHFKSWRKVKGAKVVAVCDIDKELASWTATQYGVEQVYGNSSELFHNLKPSIVDICTPPESHKDLALEALSHGCHVLIEKPMVTSLDEAEQLVQHQKNSGYKIGVVHSYLYNPVFLKTLALIKQGEIGDVISVYAHLSIPASDPMSKDPDNWCHSLPGGRLGECLPHPLYLMRALLGRTEVEGVQVAKVGPYSWITWDELNVLFRSSGRLASLYVSLNARKHSFYFCIYGKRGSIRADLVHKTVVSDRSEEKGNLGLFWIRSNFSHMQQMLLSQAKIFGGRLFGSRWYTDVLIPDFVESILSNKNPPISVEDGLENMKLLSDITKRMDGMITAKKEWMENKSYLIHMP